MGYHGMIQKSSCILVGPLNMSKNLPGGEGRKVLQAEEAINKGPEM